MAFSLSPSNSFNASATSVEKFEKQQQLRSLKVEGKKRKLKVKKKRESEGPKDSELVGFSRTEVTVIDTSLSPEWKVARVLYRKGLVWKVREKKMVRIGRKRRRKSAGSEKERKAAELERQGLALLNKVNV
ncbi:uncharacterized protein A4U43_C08F34150 [Asparagus officinalis]|nr:uncharacterized protein A4U43_C08F34150 [Asparagus officinalis]